jgi:hypothetical protein
MEISISTPKVSAGIQAIFLPKANKLDIPKRVEVQVLVK